MAAPKKSGKPISYPQLYCCFNESGEEIGIYSSVEEVLNNVEGEYLVKGRGKIFVYIFSGEAELSLKIKE